MTLLNTLYARLLLLLFCLLLFCHHAVAQEQSETIQTLSSQIKEQFSDLKQQRRNLEDYILVLQSELEVSEMKQVELATALTDLNISSTNMIEKLSNYSQKLIEYEYKLAQRAKAIAWLLIILVIRLAGMVAGYVLYAKGIKLPRWLDILL